jgi:hypothetical protein
VVSLLLNHFLPNLQSPAHSVRCLADTNGGRQYRYCRDLRPPLPPQPTINASDAKSSTSSLFSIIALTSISSVKELIFSSCFQRGIHMHRSARNRRFELCAGRLRASVGKYQQLV